MNSCMSSPVVSFRLQKLTRCLAFLAVMLVWAPAVRAVEEGFERIVFEPPRDAAIRVQGAAVRGLLISITRDKVQVETQPGTPRARRVELVLKNVASIRTSDGEFQYKANDDFKRLS